MMQLFMDITLLKTKTEVVYASINATNNDYEDSRAIKTCHIQ